MGVDLATLRKPLTGVGNYQLNLLKAVLEHSDAPDLFGFQWAWRKLDRDLLKQMAQNSHPARSAVLTALARTILDRPLMRRAYTYGRGRIFRNSLAKRSFAIFHAFAFVPPAPIQSRVLPVVYDLSFIRHPDLHPASRVQSLRRLKSELEHSDHIHTISNFSAAEICDVYQI